MHPKWQARVFNYYTGLFSSGGSQTTQIFFATHSENVISAAVKDPTNTLIVILSDDGSTIKADKIDEVVLPNTTAAEINYLAFGVKSIDYHIALYGDFQVQTSKSNIAAADSCIASQPEYIQAQHEKIDTYGPGYTTLPTYIRNKIDLPDSPRSYTDEEFERSTQTRQKGRLQNCYRQFESHRHHQSIRQIGIHHSCNLFKIDCIFSVQSAFLYSALLHESESGK